MQRVGRKRITKRRCDSNAQGGNGYGAGAATTSPWPSLLSQMCSYDSMLPLTAWVIREEGLVVPAVAVSSR